MIKNHMMRPPPKIVKIGLTILALLALGGVLYVRTNPSRKDISWGGSCPISEKRAADVKPLTVGAMAALAPAQPIAPFPDFEYADAAGVQKSLAQLRGKTIVLNLWAVWCTPCREEMPTLDRLQAVLGGDDFEVVAANIDNSHPMRAQKFFADIGVKNLSYNIAKSDAFHRLKAQGLSVGLPTTFLIGGDGCQLAALSGPADWSSEESLSVLRAAIDRK